MMHSDAKTPEEYLNSLPPDRKAALREVRDVILDSLPVGYEETVNWGMICYEIPLSRYPDTYNKQPLMMAALGNQKNHMAVYLTSVYSDKETEDWFKAEYARTGKKLHMGKSCVRFRKLQDLPLELIGEVIGTTSVNEFIRRYEGVKRK